MLIIVIKTSSLCSLMLFHFDTKFYLFINQGQYLNQKSILHLLSLGRLMLKVKKKERKIRGRQKTFKAHMCIRI